MRYMIVVSKGQKIIYREKFDNYDAAMDAMDRIDAEYGDRYQIEFKDTQPVARGF